jgi:hypothetical protein
VLAFHAPFRIDHARRSVRHLERPEGAVANACAAFDAFCPVNFKNIFHGSIFHA